jgi:hypothetical protein
VRFEALREGSEEEVKEQDFVEESYKEEVQVSKARGEGHRRQQIAIQVTQPQQAATQPPLQSWKVMQISPNPRVVTTLLLVSHHEKPVICRVHHVPTDAHSSLSSSSFHLPSSDLAGISVELALLNIQLPVSAYSCLPARRRDEGQYQLASFCGCSRSRGISIVAQGPSATFIGCDLGLHQSRTLPTEPPTLLRRYGAPNQLFLRLLTRTSTGPYAVDWALAHQCISNNHPPPVYPHLRSRNAR